MRKRNRKYRKKQSTAIVILLSTTIFIMAIGYGAFSTSINLNAKGNLKGKSRVIQSWDLYSNEDFHSDFYKENIISATFTATAIVPSNAAEKWDVSKNKDKGVMAYVTESPIETGKYDLYIGGDGGVIANHDSSYLFYKFIKLSTINFNNNYVTDNATDMSKMFSYCSNIVNVDVSSFNTKNVRNMLDMFGDMENLESVDLNNFDTPNLIILQGLFFNDVNLKIVKFGPNFDTSNVTRMYGLFYNCQSITTINLCNFNTSNVLDMKQMFMNTKKLENIYVGSGWNLNNALIDSMFSGSTISSVTTGECPK